MPHPNPYTTPRPWAPLTEAEWSAIGGHLAALGCGMSFGPRPGRPPEDVRARLDAIFRAVTIKAGDGGRAPWRALPQNFGKADTVSHLIQHRSQDRVLFHNVLMVEPLMACNHKHLSTCLDLAMEKVKRTWTMNGLHL